MSRSTKQITNMTEGKPFGLLLRFALPLMLGNICQQLYTIVDTAIVGQGLGVTALASVGAADWLGWLVLGIGQGFTQGFGVLVAIRFGEKDDDGLNRAVSLSALLSALLAVAMVIASQWSLDATLDLIDTPPDVRPGAMAYMRVIYWGIPFNIAFNLCVRLADISAKL